MTLIHYATAAISAGSAEITATASRTEENHQRSLAVVAANAENFGGRGSMAFQEHIAKINAAYAQAQEQMSQAGVTLQQANDSMVQADSRAAQQYV